MKIFAEFNAALVEKALDMARSIATFAHFEFSPAYIRMRIADPATVLVMDMILVPDTYKCDVDLSFGVNLLMLYKILRTLDKDESVTLEVDDNVMQISQLKHFHTLARQEVPATPAVFSQAVGPKIKVETKLLQKYIKALGNIGSVVDINYAPASDCLFLESVNSMYRTLFTIDTSASPVEQQEEYRNEFLLKFLDIAVHAGLSPTVDLTFGTNILQIAYEDLGQNLSIIFLLSGGVEGQA